MAKTMPNSMSRFIAGSLMVSLLAPALPAADRADWQALTGNSPFGQTAASTASATAPELEFRGMVEEGGTCLINLYDPATKTSQWIPVKGRAAGLEVQSYDAAGDKVQVTHGGRTLTLSLKQTKVALLQAPPPPLPGTPGMPGTPAEENAGNPGEDRRAERTGMRVENAGGPGQAVRNLPPEAQAMIEEFRRRRAQSAGSGRNLPNGQNAQNGQNGQNPQAAPRIRQP
jgi:hypothetical protein